MKKIVMYCSIRYHLLTAINFAYHNKGQFQADLIIHRHLLVPDSAAYPTEFISKLDALNLFGTIYYYNGSVSGTNEGQANQNAVADAFMRARLDWLLINSNQVFTPAYQEIFMFSFWDDVSLSLYRYAKSNGILVSLMENGYAAYQYSNNYFLRMQVGESGTLRFLRPDKEYAVDSLYLYEPDLYYGTLETTVKRLPRIDPADVQLKDYLCDVFSDFCMDEKLQFIYIEHSPALYRMLHNSAQLKAANDEDTINESMYKVMTNIPRPRIAVKPHNVSKMDYEGVSILPKTTPWEVLCLNSRMSERVVIAIMTTAVFSPKLILGIESDVILLYKIFGYQDVAFEGYICKVSQLYRKKRVWIPETWEEYDEIINQFLH